MKQPQSPGKVRWFALSALTAILMTGCAAEDSEHPDTPHGFVEGAEELSEPLYRLAVAQEGASTVTLVDILSGDVTELVASQPIKALQTDGRFVYAGLGDEQSLVIDGGVWSVNHGDHAHFYRAPIENLGAVGAEGHRNILHAAGPVIAVAEQGTGAISLYDRRAAEAGDLRVLEEFHNAFAYGGAVPYRNGVIRYGSDRPAGDFAFELLEHDGSKRSAFEVACAAVTAVQTFDSGVAFACSDTLVLVSHEAGVEFAQAVPYPQILERGALSFGDSFGSELLLVGAEVALLFDTVHATWQIFDNAGGFAALAPEGALLIAASGDGVLRSFERVSGVEVASIVLPENAKALRIDEHRAYLALAGERQIWEIDYRDSLRIARAFETPFEPDLMVQLGR